MKDIKEYFMEKAKRKLKEKDAKEAKKLGVVKKSLEDSETGDRMPEEKEERTGMDMARAMKKKVLEQMRKGNK